QPGIAVDQDGDAYVTGGTSSPDFPTLNAIQPTLGGSGRASRNAYVVEIAPGGSALLYSTYLGGRGFDYGTKIAVDQYAQIFVTGSTTSPDFPTLNAIQPRLAGQDAFVTSLRPGGGLLFTYLGGSDIDFGTGIAVDQYDGVYVTGSTYSANFPTVNAFQPTL